MYDMTEIGYEMVSDMKFRGVICTNKKVPLIMNNLI